MRDLASDATNKAAEGVLGGKTDRNREDVLKNEGVREKMRLMLKDRKPELKKRWKEHVKDHIRKEQWDEDYWENDKTDEDTKGKKIQMHQSINTATTNIRCINTLGKRQELARQWE